LGSWLPFEPAARLVGEFWHVPVSEPTARRQTEQAGAAYVGVQTAQVQALERELPASPAGPALQQLSVDGAMVPLVGGQWAEVKLLAIGTVGAPVWEAGEWHIHASELSYFGRMADSQTFGRLASLETHRRGTETAGRVVAVMDGAEWQQGFVDLQRADAVRILDFPHAAEYVAKVGQAVLGAGSADSAAWLAAQLHDLKHGREDQVLGVLGQLRERAVAAGAGETLQVVQTSLGYLQKRRQQLRYAAFVAQGYPIGSGAVESGNKLVTEARLKGAGMHWASEHVNPLVALRTAVCADRWDEAWDQLSSRVRAQAHQQTRARWAARQQTRAAQAPRLPAGESGDEPSPPSARPTASPTGRCSVVVADPASPSPLLPPAVAGPRKPAANHPWRRMPIGRRCPDRAAAS
jgi:hypothetical protein